MTRLYPHNDRMAEATLAMRRAREARETARRRRDRMWNRVAVAIVLMLVGWLLGTVLAVTFVAAP